ncbi:MULTISPECIES: hypothetical protein [Xanthomonas]|uniref:Uncharacterized protein n=1 Tax=Xanthomonas sacchari TaxID=56458 RepID=A0AA46SUM8_9XANT|nr:MULTISPECIES: hypothetical protein [Xanthomonas]KAB7779699.1 hypothetical protein CEK66_06260 [Xanthomonas sp. LMG 12460]MDY4282982.1 hypothetical protein [Xanthomonas sp. LF06-19]UYK88819.1 hypothetical protein NG824_20545 [Xanthomonas sacchari]
MITEDLKTANEIFSIIDSGIVDGYDSFVFEVKVGDGYIDTQLIVESEGRATTEAKTDINDAALYVLVKRLRESALQRGECWTSFVFSYRLGGQVRVEFKYNE